MEDVTLNRCALVLVRRKHINCILIVLNVKCNTLYSVNPDCFDNIEHVSLNGSEDYFFKIQTTGCQFCSLGIYLQDWDGALRVRVFSK